MTPFEKVIIDCEVLQHMSYLIRPMKIDFEEIGLAAIQKVGVGGHFFGCEHTMARYQHALYGALETYVIKRKATLGIKEPKLIPDCY